ncbi:MAG: DUF4012 domain-containing protein [Chloroflexi bacterium]|nr:DUF4012 domain-containing protein [Chloroflexota bacterium]
MIQENKSPNNGTPQAGGGNRLPLGGFLRRRPLLTLAAGLLAVLAVAFAVLLWSGLRGVSQAQNDVSAMVTSLQGRSLEQLTTPDSYAAIIRDVQGIEGELEGLRRRSQVALALGWVPGVGHGVRQVATFLEMSSRLAHAARLTLQGYAPAVQALSAGGQIDPASLRQAMDASGPLFAEARGDLASARDLRAALQDLAALGERGQGYLELVDKYLPLMELAVVVAQEAPDAVGQAVQLRETVTSLRASFKDPSALLTDPERMEDRFNGLQAQARELEEGLARVKALVQGGDPRANEALDAALEASALLADLGDALARFATLSGKVFSLGPMTPEAGALLGVELPALRQQVESAQAQLAHVQQGLAGESSGNALLSLVGGALGSSSAPLRREADLLATAAQSLDFLSYFLGYDAPRKLLLVGQNSDEIRATGGFLGVVVEMDMEKGELKGLRYLESDAVDSPTYETNPLAPEPIFRYLWISRFLFRDANWNPHFPASATQVADLYQRGQGVQTDGVIAVTDAMVLDMVGAFGEIRVPELPQALDRDMAKQYVKGDLQYPCLPRHASDRGKRCFDEDLFRALLQRLFSPMAPEVRPRVLETLLGGLVSKDILVQVFDPKAAELLWEHNWNGALRQVDHDYLMLVDSSLPGHARSVVQRRVQYQVRLDPQAGITSELHIEYRHQGKTPDPNCRQALPKAEGCYWNFLRLYIPVLAEDIQSPPIPLHEGSEWLIWGYEPADSLSIISSPRGGLSGFTEIGGYLPVEPGTSVTLPIRYHLPASRLRPLGNGVYEYRLLVQKQPGTPVEPVTLFAQLPTGASLVQASPVPPEGRMTQQGEWVRIDVDLARDTTFVVDFKVG